MERDFREAIGDMPYHRRYDGLSAIKVFEMEQLAAFLNDLITRADNLHLGRAKDFFPTCCPFAVSSDAIVWFCRAQKFSPCQPRE